MPKTPLLAKLGEQRDHHELQPGERTTGQADDDVEVLPCGERGTHFLHEFLRERERRLVRIERGITARKVREAGAGREERLEW